MVEHTGPKWVITALTSVGATLAGGLLLWIASSQLTITTNLAVVTRNQEVIVEKLLDTTDSVEARLDSMTALMNQVWPRLRTHGENIEILRREIETLCDCEITLKTPEKF